MEICQQQSEIKIAKGTKGKKRYASSKQKRRYASSKARLKCARYASSKARLKCAPYRTIGKWRYASSKARFPKGNGDMQAVKRG